MFYTLHHHAQLPNVKRDKAIIKQSGSVTWCYMKVILKSSCGDFNKQNYQNLVSNYNYIDTEMTLKTV